MTGISENVTATSEDVRTLLKMYEDVPMTCHEMFPVRQIQMQLLKHENFSVNLIKFGHKVNIKGLFGEI